MHSLRLSVVVRNSAFYHNLTLELHILVSSASFKLSIEVCDSKCLSAVESTVFQHLNTPRLNVCADGPSNFPNLGYTHLFPDLLTLDTTMAEIRFGTPSSLLKLLLLNSSNRTRSEHRQHYSTLLSVGTMRAHFTDTEFHQEFQVPSAVTCQYIFTMAMDDACEQRRRDYG
jgi:hypothetical protein